MNTILSILLLIALVLAIFFDVVRIRQYISMRTDIERQARLNVIVKVMYLYHRYQEQGIETPFVEWALKHWDEKEAGGQ